MFYSDLQLPGDQIPEVQDVSPVQIETLDALLICHFQFMHLLSKYDFSYTPTLLKLVTCIRYVHLRHQKVIIKEFSLSQRTQNIAYKLQVQSFIQNSVGV